jgi:hypothetical protein
MPLHVMPKDIYELYICFCNYCEIVEYYLFFRMISIRIVHKVRHSIVDYA